MTLPTVIPAAGLGTRLMPLSALVAKELLPLGLKPLLLHTLDELTPVSTNHVVLIGSPSKRLGEVIQTALTQDLFAKGGDPGHQVRERLRSLKLQDVLQPEPLGLGHAVLQAAHAIQGEFWVQLPDEWYPDNDVLAHMDRIMLEAQAANSALQAAVAVLEVPADQINRYGIATFDATRSDPQGRWMLAQSLVEKPDIGSVTSRLAVIGRYRLPGSIMDILARLQPGRGGEIQLTDALDILARRGELVLVPYQGVRIDTGNQQGYLEGWQYWLQHKHSA